MTPCPIHSEPPDERGLCPYCEVERQTAERENWRSIQDIMRAA